MTPLQSICTILGLFAVGVVSPGPNFLVVARSSLSGGARAGGMTGLGVACGDGLYASAALFGMESLTVQAGGVFGLIRLLGGVYLLVLGLRMLVARPDPNAMRVASSRSLAPRRLFLVGLLTDLANPKTIVFFASIFAVAYVPHGPWWVAPLTLSCIVSFSVIWRTGLAIGLSRPVLRGLYQRFQTTVDRICGACLVAVGVRFVSR